MKYKIINEELLKTNESVVDVVLQNRGVSEPYRYLHTTNNDIIDYSLLDNIQEACELILNHIEKCNNIVLIVDEDLDGVTSAAMFYKYIYDIFPKVKLNYVLHTRKSHGLSNDLVIPENTNLIILIDAGSNDVEQAKDYKHKGVDIICIDHHLLDQPNSFALIVNNQCSKKYKNKSLSGAGMCYQVLRCIDDILWESHADDFVDLAALGIISDSMDIRTYENRRIIERGLSNIKNKAFKAFIEKQSYSINGIVNIINVQFYITPLCNAIIRNNDPIEKEILFRAFCELDALFDYKKRGEEETVKEDIYTRAARLAVNAKAKQNRGLEKEIDRLNANIKKYGWNNNKFLFVNGEGLDGALTGLIAMKLSSEHNKPCLIIRENFYEKGCLSGSMRNFSGSPIENLKEFLEETKLFEYVKGHANAAGVSIKIENRQAAIDKINELLKDTDFEKTYNIDFTFDANDVTIDFIQELDKLKDYYGTEIPECLILIKNLKLNTKDIQIMGKENDTIKFCLNEDEVQCIKFKCNADDEILQLIKDDWGGVEIEIEIVGRCGFNNFNNILTPQVTIVDYNIIKRD
jgi:single-stranded-DNA-specific exonuclease